jgi:hypothetical protein
MGFGIDGGLVGGYGVRKGLNACLMVEPIEVRLIRVGLCFTREMGVKLLACKGLSPKWL